MNIRDIAKKYRQNAIDLRREFHMYPELSFKEIRTQRRIMEELDKIGIQNWKAAETGVIGIIKGKKKGKTLGLRADMDALQLQEMSKTNYKSRTDGVMHACGHDGHIASLLTAAKILNEQKDGIEGNIKLIFQPAEEIGMGAKKIIEEGEIDDIDAIFALHLWKELETGSISIESGARMAASNVFKVEVVGKGGHGSMPDQGIDALLAGAAVVTNLQSIVSREISPLDSVVITVGKFNSGSQYNILAESARLEGTTRCFSLEMNKSLEEKVRRAVYNIVKAYNASATIEYNEVVLPTINDLQMSKIGELTVINIAGEKALTMLEKTTGGEDFSYYGLKVPTLISFVGAKNCKDADNYPHHNPKFDIDENSLEIATALYAQYAIDYLERN